MSRSLKLLPVLAMGFVTSVMPAKAGVVCDGNFQIVNGQPVSTPYCEDEQLARTWQRHGIKITGDVIRRSTELKRESCLAVGDGSACSS